MEVINRYPKKLFKFLLSKYVDSMLNEGHLLFRNFTYFRQTEDLSRGDYLEAIHRDNPDNDIVISNLTTGKKYVGDCSFLNSTDSDVIFMFCMSSVYSNELHEKFKTDACIEILNPAEFIRRVRHAVQRLMRIHEKGLLTRFIHYYEPANPADVNVIDATILPFLKDEIYSDEAEYRLVYGGYKAFQLTRKIVVNEMYDFRADAMKGIVKKKILKIGSIADIADVHHVALRK